MLDRMPVGGFAVASVAGSQLALLIKKQNPDGTTSKLDIQPFTVQPDEDGSLYFNQCMHASVLL